MASFGRVIILGNFGRNVIKSFTSSGQPIYIANSIFQPKPQIKVKSFVLLMLTILLASTYLLNEIFQQMCDSKKRGYQHIKQTLCVQSSFLNRSKKRYLKFLQD